MSEIGTSFEVQKIGIMVFGNEKTSVAIESWGIDAFVASKAAAILRANFNVVPIKISKDGVAALAGAPGSLFGDRDGYICNVLRKDQGRAFDYYLKVKAHGSRYEMTNQDLQGLGIVHRQGFDTGYTYIHALFWVELLDGKTCSRLRLEEPATFQHAINGLAREVDASWMPTAANAPQDTQLKEATKALVEQGLTQTLPRLLAAN